MGLNRSINPMAGGDNNAQLRTRQRLFWALYYLDKQRVFLSGQSCDLYLFDSDFQSYGGNNKVTPVFQLQSATVQMMTIWEEIYLCLYSSRAARFGAAHRQDQIREILQLYDAFSQQQKELLSQSSAILSQELSLMQLELLYSYHVGRILVYRCDSSEQGRQESRKHSVLALKAISNAFNAPATAHTCAVLSR
jgi:hypothetical protein